jgi:hypothetical protein
VRAYTSSPGWKGESDGAEMTIPARSGHGIRVRAVGGGKFFGQRSSPAQGLQAFIWIRCSPCSWFGVGTGVFVRVRVLEEAVCWMMLRILGGRGFDMFGICGYFVIC